MNRILKNAFTALLLVLGISLLTSCDKELPTLEVASEVTITVNSEKNINASVTFSKDVTLKYTSSDTNIVTVDDKGLLKGVDIGEAIITVRVEGYDVKKEVKVTVNPLTFSLTGPSEVMVGKSIKLTVSDEKGGTNVLWSSSDEKIATVDNQGNVLGISAGEVDIVVVSSITGEVLMKKIIVKTPKVESLEVVKETTGKALILEEIQMKQVVYPAGANTEVTWTSSDETIATVDENGLVKTLKSGEVDIIATSVEDPEISGKYTLIVEVDPIELMKKFHVANPLYVTAKSNLISELNEQVIGSVNLYWNDSVNLRQDIMPVENNLVNPTETNPYKGLVATREIVQAVELRSRRPGVLKPEIKYITFHDTGNYAAGATAAMHASYIHNSERYRSWHYTVDEKEVVQHLPDNEIAFHGDAYDAYVYSIGIETAINKGSDFFKTWHRASKLIAGLLVKYNLTIDAIEQHHDWNGKDCPQVLRASGLWDTVLAMIQAEYLVLTELQGYTIEFMSSNQEYVSNSGRVLKLDSTPKTVSYAIHVYNNEGYDKIVMLTSTLPGTNK